jgi:hypothetical protein
MTKFFGGLICGLVLLAMLGATEGGFRVDWKSELAQKENQQILNNYIDAHCHIMPGSTFVGSDGKQQITEPIMHCIAWDDK